MSNNKPNSENAEFESESDLEVGRIINQILLQRDVYLETSLEIVKQPQGVSKKVIIGRNMQADIQILVESVSKLHCSIEYLPALKSFVITDLESENGTQILTAAGRVIELKPYESVQLQHMDNITLGSIEHSIVFVNQRTNNLKESKKNRSSTPRLQIQDTEYRTVEQTKPINYALVDEVEKLLLDDETATVPIPKLQFPDIFISYSHDNQAIFDTVIKDLEAANLSVWSDTQLTTGTKWQTKLEEAIHQARCVVALLSPTAKKSEWVERELTVATDFGKPIFPLLVAGNKSLSIPFILKTSQFADARDKNYEAGIAKLIADIQAYFASTDLL
jgi:predicted nucleotide-binding protein